jgi:hypothetical protein
LKKNSSSMGIENNKEEEEFEYELINNKDDEINIS